MGGQDLGGKGVNVAWGGWQVRVSAGQGWPGGRCVRCALTVTSSGNIPLLIRDADRC